jgi:ankyrin repeat protein
VVPVSAEVKVEESETALIESYHQSLYHDLSILNGIESAIERSSDLVQTMNMTDSLEAALHLAVEKRYDGAVRSLLCYGICMGLDVNNIIPNSGRTALHCACAMIEVDIARLLLNVGANVNLKDKYGSAALHIDYSMKCHNVGTAKRRSNLSKCYLIMELTIC